MNVRHLAARVPGAQPVTPGSGGAPAAPAQAPETSFADLLQRARQTEGLKLSAHAQQRISQRAIPMTEAQQQSMTEAMQTLDAKGARDALMIRSDAAFVVNVPSRTVVTALDQSELQQRVFTQIDSAILL